MARLPPNLSYLTIYNPTLSPTGPVSKDDEDAEEQAQILFYTSKERAVSRDTMLRQIGLAKALTNFSEMFSGGESCDSIHSQTRRMVMSCPEPDFWIHAGVELAKTPRTPAKPKGKGKEKEPIVGYDYSDASVHDLALKADIMKGYEHFKLTHGSFTSILSTQGRTALELQLERFFTPWAWSWNLEDGYEFGEHLGVALHPRHTALAPLLEEFSYNVPVNAAPIVLTSRHIIPSRRYTNGRLPHSLLRHLLSLVPPSPESSELRLPSDPEGTLRLKQPTDPGNAKGIATRKDADPTQNHHTFIGIPTGNLNMKWGWPGYLTFGKSSQARAAASPASSGQEQKDDRKPETEETDDKASVASQPVEAEVDKGALDYAMSSDNVHIGDRASVEGEKEVSTLGSPASVTISELDKESSSDSEVIRDLVDSSPEDAQKEGGSSVSVASSEPAPAPLPPPRQFSSTSVHIADPDNPLLTQRRKVYHLSQGARLVALVSLDDEVAGQMTGDPSLSESLSMQTDSLLREIEQALNENSPQSASPDSTPVAKLLQRKDRYIMAMPHFTVTESGKFASKSQHLYNAQELLESDLDVKEVFSRGQNPQHWHVGRKLGSNGEVYMEVFNKESSLTDVDNSLAGLVRRMDGLSDM